MTKVSEITSRAIADMIEYYKPVGGKIEEISLQLAETAKNFKSKSDNESAKLGEELIDAAGWTSSGWTGEFVAGFTNTVGNTSPLRRTIPSTGTRLFQVGLTVNSPTKSTDFTVSIGNSFAFIMYEGDFTDHTYYRGIQSVTDGDLVITPGATFNGTISNITVKEITGTTDPTTTVKGSNELNTFEGRFTSSDLMNMFLGVTSGMYNTTGHENVALGQFALRQNTTGFWNVAIGKDAMNFNTTGSRNIALGYASLIRNISGHRNIGIGPFTLQHNTHGIRNITLGADSLMENTTGNDNNAHGFSALYGNTTGNSNIALGTQSLLTNQTGSYNIAIGELALGAQTSGNDNIAIGFYAAHKQNGISESTAIGTRALYQNTGGIGNVAVGFNAGRGSVAGAYRNGVYIGYQAGYNLIAGANNNVLIGYKAGYNAQSSNNILIGWQAGDSIASGSGNILIGYNVDTPAATTSNHLNIGGVLFGDLNLQRIGVRVAEPTAILHLPANTPGTAALKMDAGTLMTTPQSGAIEFDGTNLYYTTSGGVRKTITAA